MAQTRATALLRQGAAAGGAGGSGPCGHHHPAVFGIVGVKRVIDSLQIDETSRESDASSPLSHEDDGQQMAQLVVDAGRIRHDLGDLGP